MRSVFPAVGCPDIELLNDLSFLSAPGKLGSLIAAHDWAQTPLGPIERWPQSLRTSVSLILNSPHPLWIGWGPEMTYLYNDAYIDVLSLAKHPWALGRPAAEVWAEIWDFVGPLAERVIHHAEGTFVDDMRLFMRRDDYVEETYYSFSHSPILNEAGQVGGLFCPSTDVTSKNVNARRLRTLSELSASVLIERSEVATYETAAATLAKNPDDIPFALLYACEGENLRLQRAVGIAPDSALAPPVVLPGTDAPWPLHAVRSIKQTCAMSLAKLPSLHGLPVGLADQPLREAVLLPLLASGHKRVLGVIVMGVSPARKLGEEYRTFFELVADQVATAINNARAAEAQHRHAEQLAELDRAKTAFFSNVSHEFRTPLTLMLGPMDDALADTTAPLPPVQHERLQLMRRNALRLQKLVNSLLDFSRVQAGRMEANLSPVDLPTLTTDLCSSFRSVIETAGLNYEVEITALSQPAYVDQLMWEKIVLNLISNAFKFTFEGTIRVALSEQDGKAVLCVADTGTGISPDHLARVFERFQRVESARSRTHEGSGIGLALVHDLVELHGGQIVVESEVDKGSHFIVEIPLGRAHLRDEQVHEPPLQKHSVAESFTAEAERWLPAHASLAPAPLEASDIPSSTKGARVLVADDNADMRTYLQRLLQERWKVEVVSNGREALQAAQRDRPDLILSDVMMPELDGFGLISALRSDEALTDVPVILLSARAGEEARIEGMNAGADDYMVKPFSARELVTRVDAQLVKEQIRKIERRHAARLSDIFRQAPAAIAIMRGPEHVFEMANAGYLKLVNGRQVEGKSARDAFPELEGQGIFELLDGVYASGQPHIGHAVQVALKRGPQGEMERCFFDFVYQPMLDLKGRIEGIAVVAFEVTDLVEARRAAEVANRAKDEFLAMLGHELRNPLSPILIALDMMRLRGQPGVDKERAVIERQAKHLVRLVDDLLDVARIAQGKIELKRAPIETARLVAQAIETAGPLLEERKHSLRVDVPATGLPILADATRFAQIVANLLTNAAKYTDKGGQIEVKAFRQDDDMVLQVKDSGIGICADMLPHVFEKFTQENQAIDRSQGGLGLGLAIVKSLVALHGGTVSACSEGLGRGSLFEVRVPMLSTPGVEASPAPIPDSAANPALSILLVDDIADIRNGMAELLRLSGYHVVVAEDAISALKTLESFKPDVAVMDIGLPGMNGYELALEIRKRPEFEQLRLVALTGYGHEVGKSLARRAGFSAHLVKPIEIEELEAVLAEIRPAGA